jgi:hypothetical protein
MKKDTWTYAAIGAIILVVVYVYLKGKSNAATGTSVANSPNSPIYPVTSMGSQVTQLIPTNQVTPNEPGTAPIFNTSSGPQYG